MTSSFYAHTQKLLALPNQFNLFILLMRSKNVFLTKIVKQTDFYALL